MAAGAITRLATARHLRMRAENWKLCSLSRLGLWTEANSTWHRGKLESLSGDPDAWKGLQQSRPISKDKTVGAVLKVIRDALAHGNIWTLRDPIEAIIFAKSVTDADKVAPRFEFVSVAPNDFRKLLEEWFDFLISLHIPQAVVFEVFQNAA